MYLVGNLTVVTLMYIALRVIDDCLDNPLMIECREAGRFVEQFVYVFIRSIRFHLKICHGKRLFQKLSQKFSQIVDMCFEFFRRWNGRWWNGIGRITGSGCGMDGRRSRQKSLSALFLLLYRVFYGFNYILTSRNRIFILKSIITWCNKSVKPVSRVLLRTLGVRPTASFSLWWTHSKSYLNLSKLITKWKFWTLMCGNFHSILLSARKSFLDIFFWFA